MHPPSKSEKIKILLLGHGGLGLALLEGLLRSPDVEILGVFVWSNRTGCKKFMNPDEVRFIKRVQQLGLNEIFSKGANSFEFIQLLDSLRPDVLLIGSWGEILKPHVLAIPYCKVINCHPSLLPAHRGANPYVSVIRCGDPYTGVTFHMVDENIDTGPLLLQQPIPVSETDTGGSLQVKCAEAAQGMVPVLMEMLTSNEPLQPVVQDETLQSYFPPIKMEDGMIFWEYPPMVLYNQVRGLQPWLDCYMFLEGELFLTFSKMAIARQEVPAGAEPVRSGTILKYERGVIWVATTDPEIRLGISEFKIYLMFFFVPKVLSKIAGLFMFQKGLVFRNNYQQPEQG